MKRKDVEYIAKTKWFRETCKKLGEDFESTVFDRNVGSKTIQQVIEFGFPMEVVRDTIENKKLNQANVCLSLLKGV